MLRTIPRVLITMGVVAAVAMTAGCGADKKQACTNIQQELQNLFQTGSKQVRDPKALATTMQDSAKKIRDQGGPVGGDVEKASDEAATALEQVADKVAKGTPSQADLNPLLKAGTNIRQACAGS